MPQSGRHAPFRRPAPRRAVTFLEMMIVLIIMGLLVAFSIPAMKGGFLRTRVKASTRDFATRLAYARRQAVLRNHTVEVRISAENNRYLLDLAPAAEREYYGSSRTRGERERRQLHSLDPDRGEVFFAQIDGLSNAADDDRIKVIRFFRNGSATPATVVVTDKDGRSMTVEVAGSTGAIRAYGGSPKEHDTVEVNIDWDSAMNQPSGGNAL